MNAQLTVFIASATALAVLCAVFVNPVIAVIPVIHGAVLAYAFLRE